MGPALVEATDVDTFLRWEERQELRHEFDGVGAVAMTGGTAAHAVIQRNLAIAIGGRLRGLPCQFFGSDFKVRLAGTVRYPDGIVVCTPVPPASRYVTDPVVIFEVLSHSTAHVDVGAKNREYEATPSVRRYVVLEQGMVAGTQFERVGGDWIGRILRAESVLRMPEIGVALPLRDLYDGLS